jgi:hypothetical protein
MMSSLRLLRKNVHATCSEQDQDFLQEMKQVIEEKANLSFTGEDCTNHNSFDHWLIKLCNAQCAIVIDSESYRDKFTNDLLKEALEIIRLHRLYKMAIFIIDPTRATINEELLENLLDENSMIMGDYINWEDFITNQETGTSGRRMLVENENYLHKAIKDKNFSKCDQIQIFIDEINNKLLKWESELEQAIIKRDFELCETIQKKISDFPTSLEQFNIKNQAAEEVEVKKPASATSKPTPVPAAAPKQPMSEKEKEVKEMADNKTINEPIKGNKDGFTPLIQDVIDGDVEKVNLLIQYGAKVDLTEKHGNTALMFAAWDNHIEIAKLLIASNANLDLQKKDGDTALKLARDRGYTEMIQLLEEAGAKQ